MDLNRNVKQKKLINVMFQVALCHNLRPLSHLHLLPKINQ